MWHLPIDAETLAAYELPASTTLRDLKNDAFRRHLANAHTPDVWAQYADTHIDYLRNLYPGIYLYGPNIEAAEKFGNAFLEAYRTHGIEVLTSLPQLSLVSGEEFKYLETALKLEFLEHLVQRNEFTGELTDYVLDIAKHRGDDLTETQNEMANYELADTVEMILARDFMPATHYFTNYLNAYNAYRQRWDLP